LTTLLLALGTASPTRAGLEVNYAWDGSLTGAGFMGGALIGMMPVDEDKTWERELFPFDEGVKSNFSAKAAAVSDTLLLTSVLIPPAARVGSGIDRDYGKSSLLYAQALGVTFCLTNAVKHLVQRPRPYTYNTDERVQRFADKEGKDSRLSFFSGHSSLSFSAAVAGSYLFALSSQDSQARAVIWGVELALASATANLRARAGKHFYSDVIVGALVGSALGFAVPFLHEDSSSRYTPAVEEWGAMAGGLVFGILASQLIPFKQDIREPLEAGPLRSARYMILPIELENGAGMMIAAAF